MKHYNLGKTLEDQQFFRLLEEELNTHLLVLGTTGGGKSRLLWQLLREHRRNHRGFCLIDSGDLIDDFLADCAREVIDTGSKRLLHKVHLAELSPFLLARYDPFRFHYPKPIHPELRETVYKSWQHTKVQSHAEVYQRKQGQSMDFEGMPRLQRTFINVFTAVSTLVDQRRLSVGDAQILIDLGHPYHYRVYERLKPHLPREIVADFEVLHRFTSVRDLRTETESFLNRIRSMHGPLLKKMLSVNGTDPVLDLHQIIQRGDFLLVKVAKSPFASSDQNQALAGMFIHDIHETMLLTPRELRKPFTLMIDEAHKHVGPDIGEMARTARKLQLSLVLGTTDLVSLRKGELDLAPELLGVANTVIAFRMTWPEDLKQMAEFLYAQNLDFTELVHEVERRAGQEWIPVDEWSETFNRQTAKARTQATTLTEAASAQQTTTHSAQVNVTATRDAQGLPLHSARGGSTADSTAASRGRTTATAVQTGQTDTETEGYGLTLNHKLVHLEKIIREKQKTGMLGKSVADQLVQFVQTLSGQARRRAVVRVRERKAVAIETLEVNDPFLSPEARAKAVEWMRRELLALHPYMFVPSFDPAEDEKRLREFLDTSETAAADVIVEANVEQNDPARDRNGRLTVAPRLVAHANGNGHAAKGTTKPLAQASDSKGPFTE